MRIIVAFVLAAGAAGAAVITEEASIAGNYLKMIVAPNDGCVVTELSHTGTAGDYAGKYGLLLEGFGVGNPYVPQVRSNEKLEVDESVTDRPVLRYSYDCQGANIKNFHVTRTLEPMPNEASIRVRWRVENNGDERQWVVPWVRNDIAPGGKFNQEDRIDVPTLSGVRDVRRSGYFAASRNWIASTDPIEQVTVYGVFNAEQTHAFLTLWDDKTPSAGFHTAFVPRLLNPGEAWETTYRINVVRGLRHVDFAASELAAQVEYKEGGKLEVLISAATVLKDLEIHASVMAPNGRRWKLEPKRFSIDPDHVVRCTFDWNAPGASSYDLLAELRHRGGKQFVLSGEMATPHGGIDTQFVVGNASEDRAMDAWTDAPHALDRGPRKLQRSVAVQKPFALWVESSLEKIHPDDQVQPVGPLDKRVRLSLARNERESFQVVLRPEGESLRGVTVKTSPLVNSKAGATIAAENISVHNVSFHRVQVPSFYEGPTGLWPDALPAFKPFDAQSGTSNPVWVTVYAPAGIPAGVYQGTLTVGAQDSPPVELAVEVTVHDFDLPLAPALKTDFGFWPDRAVQTARSLGSKTAAGQISDAYAVHALAHRVTLREAVQLPEPGPAGAYQVQLAAYAPRLSRLQQLGAGAVAVPAALINDPAALKLANEFVRQNKLDAFCHIADEPPPPVWQKTIDVMKKWAEVAPDIPMMITNEGFQPLLPEGVKIWAVHTPLMDTLNNQPVLEHIEKGKSGWWYVNHQTPRPYCNFLLDFASMEHRMLFWQSWALGISGVHYWATNFSIDGQDVYSDIVDVTPVNGDGLLIYPSADGPVASIRLENIRDGIDDYDYLTILMQRARQAQQADPKNATVARAAELLNIKDIAPDLVTIPKDPGVLLKRRDQIADAIVELGLIVK